MSPKTGRPPMGESSKDRGYRIRMSDEELQRLTRAALQARLKRGWSIEKALTTPTSKK